MNIKAIRTDEEYRLALRRAEAIFMAAPGTEEYAELDRLATLIEEYEDKWFPITPGEEPSHAG